MPKAKLKDNGLSSLAREIAKQHDAESVAGLLLIMFLQICSEKSGVERNTKCTFWRGKKAPGNNATAKECSGRETGIVVEISTVKGGFLFF